MDSVVTWLIVAVFYAPLHYLVPILVVALRNTDGAQRRRAIRAVAIDCSISMILAFGLVIWLAEDHLTLAMLVLLVAMALPYLRIALQARNAT